MLEINDISVKFKSGNDYVSALSSLNLTIKKNEYISLIGPNGSGKSTLLKAICGFIPLNHGTISFEGRSVKPDEFDNHLFGKIGIVFQEPSSQFLMPTVEKEIVSVLQNLGLEIDEQQDRLDEIVKLFSLEDILQFSPENLSGGQTQIVNLACALSIKPDLILLDEPTTFLDTNYRAVLLDYLDSVVQNGIAVLHITQYPDEALRSQRICLIDNGTISADGKPDEILSDSELTDKHRIIMPVSIRFEKSFGASIKEYKFRDRLMPDNQKPISISGKKIDSKPIITAKNISFKYDSESLEVKLDNLILNSGEVTSIIGPTGSGKTTLAYLLSGLLKPDIGDLTVNNLSYRDLSNKQLRSIIGISLQVPEIAQIGPTVLDDIEMSLKFHQDNKKNPHEILENIGLSGFADRIVDTLSGGEKRKLSLAGLLAMSPEYLIFDEPAAFLDPHSQIELTKIISDLASSGKGILIIGHELELISQMSDRILGMKAGKLAFDIPSAEFFNNSEYQQELGLPKNPILNFRENIRKSGIDLATNSISPENIASELKSRRIISTNIA